MNPLDWLDQLPRRRLLTLIFIVALISNATVVLISKGNTPPKPGDGIDYDAIAFCLADGRGFGRDLTDPRYRLPYQQSDKADEYADQFANVTGYSLTTYRPPALPFVLAGIYRTIGRHFVVWRMLNCVFVALAVTLAAALALKLAGQWAGIFCGIFGCADPSLKRYAGNFLTEGMAMLMVALLAWALVKLFEHRTLVRAALVGLALGAMVLVRSIFVLWWPMTLFVGGWLWRRPSDKPRRPMLVALGMIVLIALLTPGAWWVRNCRLLDAFLPMGTQGGIGLPGGYSDAALANDGFWIDAVAAVPEMTAEFERLAATDRTPLQINRDLSQFGTKFVFQWMAANPGGVVKLMALKGYHLWTRPSTIQGLVFLGLGLLGVRWCWRRRDPAMLVPWFLIGFNMLAAMGTYITHGGRFIVAVLPMLHIVGAIGLWRLIDHLDSRPKAQTDSAASC